MPVMNGIEATVKIRELLQGHPTIIVGVTGHVQQSFKNEGEAAGMDQILEKPLYSEALQAALTKYGIK